MTKPYQLIDNPDKPQYEFLLEEDISRQELTLLPLCPFVALNLKPNPEWKQLVLKGINIE